MLKIDVRADFRPLTRDLDRLQRRQIPFATAQTLTAVARKAAVAEQTQLSASFATPTPFTKRAFGVTAARKSTLTATIFVKDIQAAYLAPYIVGGKQALGAKKAILTPRDATLNAYGNLPKRAKAYLAQPDTFAGTVTFASGKSIAGVWRRGDRGRRRGKRGPRAGRYGTKGKLYDHGVGQKTTLELLFQFTRPSDVTHRFPYEAVARRAVLASLPAEWDRAWSRALATAR